MVWDAGFLLIRAAEEAVCSGNRCAVPVAYNLTFWSTVPVPLTPDTTRHTATFTRSLAAAPTCRRARIGIRTSASLLALCVAAPAMANCPEVVSGGSETCTVTEGEGIDNIFVTDTSTSSQATYTINNSAPLTVNSDLNEQNYGILVDIYGEAGETDDSNTSEAGGIAGGNLTITNSGAITMTGTTAQSANQGQVAGIRAFSYGGNGVEPDDRPVGIQVSTADAPSPGPQGYDRDGTQTKSGSPRSSPAAPGWRRRGKGRCCR